eukprot:m.69238 g.69238  ORF g.69238 m.69238 type:complete len:141 (+) comp24068_c0_seq1:214-636(+)
MARYFKSGPSKSKLIQGSLHPELHQVEINTTNEDRLGQSVTSLNELKSVQAEHLKIGESEYGKFPLSLKLGEHALTYDGEQWRSNQTNGANLTDSVLAQKNTELMEENNILKYKVEVLLDLLATSRAQTKMYEAAKSHLE